MASFRQFMVVVNILSLCDHMDLHTVLQLRTASSACCNGEVVCHVFVRLLSVETTFLEMMLEKIG